MIFLGEHWFESAASTQAKIGPIVIRPDGIKDDRKARQYIGSVLGMLRAMENATQTGKAVLTTIRFHNRPVLIFPYDGQLGRCNAWARSSWGMFSATVSFTPFLKGDRSRCACSQGGVYAASLLPHELLIHELTHIVRAVSGTLGKLRQGDEEELAVMVANIFAVEINRRPIDDYVHGDEVTGDLATFSRDYHDENFEMIEAFCRQNKQLAVKLARVKTAFNPLLQYMNEARPPEWPGR
ncbi:MAG TPA: hypothetical protein VJR58_03720 [Vineibacter sp.]|nr:hypothetical protein [Vineibacter sp.]